MSARDRAAARWAGAPKKCSATYDRGDGFVLSCNRDKHPGEVHRDKRFGSWTQEAGPLRHAARKASPSASIRRQQFCDLDWEAPHPDAAQFYASYDVGRDSLFTVGTCGGVYLRKDNFYAFASHLRQWADMIEEYMETWHKIGKDET